MDQIDYIEMGLNGEAPLKVIMRGSNRSVEWTTSRKMS